MPFQKGQSGNPKGRPPGIRDRRSLVSELLAPRAPDLLAKVIERALAGDQVLLKACLDKLIPNAKSETRVALQDPKQATDSQQVVQTAASGQVSLEEARSMMELLALKARVDEITELRARIEALEDVDESSS